MNQERWLVRVSNQILLLLRDIAVDNLIFPTHIHTLFPIIHPYLYNFLLLKFVIGGVFLQIVT